MEIYGKGSIVQLDTGVSRYKCRRWRLMVSTENGRRSRVFKGTVRDARAALEAFMEELAGEVPCKRKFASYALSWLDERKAIGSYSPNTISKDARRVRTLSAVFGDKDVDAITPADVRAGFIDMRNGGLPSGRVVSGTYLNGLFRCMSSIMRQAEDDGLVSSNPCAKVAAPKMDTEEKRALGREELGALLDALDGMPIDSHVVAVYCIVLLGLRRGEACALSWDDIDCDADTICIRHSVSEETGEVGTTKNGKPRTLPMPARLVGKLEEWDALCATGLFGTDVLCPSMDGGYMRTQNLYKWWGKHQRELGCEGVTLHQLRHSNLTAMARLVPSPFDLQQWAGWSSLEPAQVYIHRDGRALAGAADRLDF